MVNLKFELSEVMKNAIDGSTGCGFWADQVNEIGRKL